MGNGTADLADGEYEAIPRLKGVVWERVESDLRVVYDRREQLLIADPHHSVAQLLTLLRDNDRSVTELASTMSAAGRPAVSPADVAAAIALLDEYGLVEDGAHDARLNPAETERHFSNLAFYESFASLTRGRTHLHRGMRDAHVLVLGTGGLNSNVIPHLCGLGVGRLTLLDRDAVEARNFARQYLYRWSEIGTRKVHRAADWVRAFDPTIRVESIDAGIDGPEQLGDLLDRLNPDIVASGIDHPEHVDAWVNAACVPRRVPFVRGGMWVTEGIVYSVDPGRSGCLRCTFPETTAGETTIAEPLPDAELVADVRAGLALHSTKARVNRGIGPVAGLLGALSAFEVMRYLTGFAPPAYAANPMIIDFARGCTMRHDPWPRDPHCPLCGPGSDFRPGVGTELASRNGGR
jgi:molybdopterin/thiamine biosynthesis adenylyltransferase